VSWRSQEPNVVASSALPAARHRRHPHDARGDVRERRATSSFATCSTPTRPLRKVSFNGHVSRTNPATGQAENPCLLSVMVDREEFTPLVLDQVSAEECLRHLKALVSAHPYAVEAVRPLVDFDRSRYAFVEGIDVVAGLDHRNDLMTLTPTEFEHLVRQLLKAGRGILITTSTFTKDAKTSASGWGACSSSAASNSSTS
jgi:hypothetical protein